MVTSQTAVGQHLGSLKGSGTFLHSSSLTDHAFLFEGLAQSLDFFSFSDSDNLILSTNSQAGTSFILIMHVPEKIWQVDHSEAAPQTRDLNTAVMSVIPPPTSRGSAGKVTREADGLAEGPGHRLLQPGLLQEPPSFQVPLLPIFSQLEGPCRT